MLNPSTTGSKSALDYRKGTFRTVIKNKNLIRNKLCNEQLRFLF